MTFPLQITYRHLEPNAAADELIREKAEKLGQLDRVTSCRVVIEAPHRSQSKGNHYKVTIDLNIPGTELVVDRSPDQRVEHEDLFVAIREAFDHAWRELEKYERRRRDRRHVESI